jgi:hypothetical protein
MKINKTNISNFLAGAGISATYLNDDPQYIDPCFDLHGIYEGIQISFGRGAALIAKQLSETCIADQIITDANELMTAIQTVSKEQL